MKHRILNFKVNGQILSKDGDFSNIVRGSNGYLKCYFTFSDEWEKLIIIAQFFNQGKEYAVLVKNGMCDIPPQVTTNQYFSVKLNGFDRKRKHKLTSNEITIRQV